MRKRAIKKIRGIKNAAFMCAIPNRKVIHTGIAIEEKFTTAAPFALSCVFRMASDIAVVDSKECQGDLTKIF